MKRINPTLLFFSCSIICFAQTVKIQTITQTNPITREVYIFPKVVSSNTLAAQRMNNTMRMDLLTETKNVKDADIFKEVWTTKDKPMAQLNEIAFEKIAVNPIYICLSISAEGCGAYCEGFTRYYMFNTKTGNLLTPDSIFNKDGINFILKTINNYKAEMINSQLKLIEDSLRSPKAKDKENFTDMKDMYTDCLQYKTDPGDISSMTFFIKGNSLTVITGRCSPHALMALDELWEFKNEFRLKEMTKLLSKFGLALIK
jgi:hypothetical protein